MFVRTDSASPNSIDIEVISETGFGRMLDDEEDGDLDSQTFCLTNSEYNSIAALLEPGNPRKPQTKPKE
jgi:hypothetical protein